MSAKEKRQLSGLPFFRERVYEKTVLQLSAFCFPVCPVTGLLLLTILFYSVFVNILCLIYEENMYIECRISYNKVYSIAVFFATLLPC